MNIYHLILLSIPTIVTIIFMFLAMFFPWLFGASF